MKYLYNQVHTSTGNYEYETHEADVPLRYTSHVYDGSNNVVHAVNDIVYNGDDVVYKHRKGDTKLDDNGKPIPVNTLELNRYINLLFMDYVSCKQEEYCGYKKQIKSYLTENITTNAVEDPRQTLGKYRSLCHLFLRISISPRLRLLTVQ